jgi:hypothetical protein
MVERIPENDDVAALDGLEAINEFIDEDALLIGEQRKTMMTSARPMAMSKSRVQTRISFRREWTAEGAGAEGSGTDEVRAWFWSVLCILCCLLFIAWGCWPR